jgi:cytochrome c biogenesis protein
MSETATDLGTTPSPPVIPIGFFGWLRWAWRALTSMRVALMLLFLLALASVPGSLFPQRGSKPLEVTAYLARHKTLGPILDRIGMFNVFGSAWFAAIYLLLFISLAGCVIPRSRLHLRAIRARPPIAPVHPARLPGGHSWASPAPLGQLGPLVLAEAARTFRRSRWRTDISELGDGPARARGYVSAEKGYARETGNLLFHVALLVLLVGIGLGSAFGWKGQVIVKEGDGFANTVTQYDTFTAGRLVDQSTLPPFTVKLDAFDITYQDGGPQNGEPLAFGAQVLTSGAPGSPAVPGVITANHPLGIGDVRVYLIGHGYAPHIVVRDKTGKVVFDDTVVFLPQDGNFTSLGVVKIPDMTPQLGLQGFFLPTAFVDPVLGPSSVFPGPKNPALFLSAWRGDLGLNSGTPQSVYRLDLTHLKRISIKELRPGDTWVLPDGSGTVAFVDIAQYATLSVAYDPGKGVALVSALTAILGLMLSLFVRRRRIWVRVSDSGSGGTLVEVGGLTRVDSTDVSAEVARMVTALRAVAPEAKE